MTIEATAVPSDAILNSDGMEVDNALLCRTENYETRRQALTKGALAAGAIAAAALLTSSGESKAQGGGAGHDPTTDWADPVLRLLRRITYGLRADEVALARTLGYAAFLEYQLSRSGNDTAMDAFIAANYPTLVKTAPQLYAGFKAQSQPELIRSTFYRAIVSRNQLYERMVEFWTYHFNIKMVADNPLLTVDNRDVIRANALGKFPDMVYASMHSPAMMVYLNNNTSKIPIPNQNYARELMELHTLGVDGGYSQTDVNEVARCLTGWSLQTTGANIGKFVFFPAWHDNGIKTVLGQTIPANGGMVDGDRVHQILTSHPSCAKFISKKMLKWLLRYDPSQSQIDEVATVYLTTGGDIKAMIRVILQQSWLVAAPAKFKRPYHLGISAIRTSNAVLGVTPATTLSAVQAAQQKNDTMYMPMFGWGTPDGYPDRAEFWGGGLTTRWAYTRELADGTFNNVTIDLEGQFKGNGTPDGIVTQLNNKLFFGEMSSNLKVDLKAFLMKQPYSVRRLKLAVGLALGSPDFQWY